MTDEQYIAMYGPEVAKLHIQVAKEHKAIWEHGFGDCDPETCETCHNIYSKERGYFMKKYPDAFKPKGLF